MPRLKILIAPASGKLPLRWLQSWDPAVLLVNSSQKIPAEYNLAGEAGERGLVYRIKDRDFNFSATINSRGIRLDADCFQLLLSPDGQRLTLLETADKKATSVSQPLDGLELVMPAALAQNTNTLLAADDGCPGALVLEVGDDQYFDELRVNPFGTARRRRVATAIRILHERGFLIPGMRVFDFGCGQGDDVRWLRRRGIDAIGFDPWPAYGKNHWPEGQFDALIIQQVLEYIPFAKERVNALKQALAYLKPGGLVYYSGSSFGTMTARSEKRELESFSDGWFTNPARRVFQHGFTSAEVADINRECEIEPLEFPLRHDGRVHSLGTYHPVSSPTLLEHPTLPVTWIDKAKDLAPALTRLAAGGRVGLDVETTIYQTPRKLCTVQIASDDEIVILDALKLKNLDVLGAFLADPDVVKIIHNARFEISVFRPYGYHIANVYDTMLASRRIHGPNKKDGHSLAACCKRELGYEIDKCCQTSVWTLRPLSRGQLDYAALDAEVLLALHGQLVARNNHAGIFS